MEREEWPRRKLEGEKKTANANQFKYISYMNMNMIMCARLENIKTLLTVCGYKIGALRLYRIGVRVLKLYYIGKKIILSSLGASKLNKISFNKNIIC